MIERRHIKLECQKARLNTVTDNIILIRIRLMQEITDSERLILAGKLRKLRRKRTQICNKLNTL